MVTSSQHDNWHQYEFQDFRMVNNILANKSLTYQIEGDELVQADHDRHHSHHHHHNHDQ